MKTLRGHLSKDPLGCQLSEDQIAAVERAIEATVLFDIERVADITGDTSYDGFVGLTRRAIAEGIRATLRQIRS